MRRECNLWLIMLTILVFEMGCQQNGKQNDPSEEIDSKTMPGLKLRRIAGTGTSLMMGSPESQFGHRIEEKQHEVRLSRDYHLGVTHVTRGQFAAFAKATKFLRKRAISREESGLIQVLNRETITQW